MKHIRHTPQLNGITISDTSIRRPVLVTMVMVLLLVLGGLAYFTLPVNLVPDTATVRITTTIPYPGANPATIADQVAEPVEDELSTLSGIDHLTSRSRQGVATIIAEFEMDVDEDVAYQDVREKVSQVIPDLPDEVEEPVYRRFDINQKPIMDIAISDDGSRSPRALRQLVDDEIATQMQQVRNVGSVTVEGGEQRQINVLIDLDAMNARKISPVQVIQALEAANTNLGMGTIREDNLEVSLHAPTLLQEPQDINQVRITGTPYRIGDIATVEDGVAEDEQYARLDGDKTIIVRVRKQSGSNTVEVAEAARAELDTLFARYSDLSYNIVRDDSTFVQQSVRSSLTELVAACVAAMIVVFLFFRDVRGTLITVAGLPVIMIGTFVVMAGFDMSINLITLVALAVSVGLVIDDAIVVRENVFRHMERGEQPMQAASRGTAEVAVPVLAMTLTVIAVFVPITFATGVTGIIFRAFGLTVAAAVLISLFEAFTMAPMLSAYFFKQETPASQPAQDRQSAQDNNQPDQSESAETSSSETQEEQKPRSRLVQGYARFLHWSLRHRWLVIVLAVLFIVASIATARTLNFAFMPEYDPGEFYASFEMQPGTPLEVTDEQARKAEEVLLNHSAIETVLTTVGGAGTPERAEFFVTLREGEATPPVRRALREELAFLPQLAFNIPGIAVSGSTDVTGREVQLSLETNRPIETILPVMQQVQQEMQAMPGVVDVDTSYEPGKPQLEFSLKPTLAGDVGITNQDIAVSVRTMIDGTVATTLQGEGEDTDIMVRLQPDDRASMEDLQDIRIPTRSGNETLGSLVDIETDTAPATLRRYDRANQILIGANTTTRTANQVKTVLGERVQQMDAPAHMSFGFVGESEQMTEGFSSLLIAMGLSVLFVYMVLAAQFESFTQPLIIMLAMPFSFMGSFLALKLLGLNMTINSMVGLVLLLGLVVKNSILLVEVANGQREAGLSADAAMEHAGAVRLRPILMTSLSLIAGVLPVVIGIGEGSEIRRGLSVAIMGGMISSTLLTLLVVPTAYSLFASVGQFFQKREEHDESTSASMQKDYV
jgi:HAE1 family hydrophobic/amphiphilic exporter-1